MPSRWEERRPTTRQPLLLCGSFSLPHIFQDLGQDTHQLTLPGLLGSVHCDSDPVPGNLPTPSAAAAGPKCWWMLWPFNLWWRRLELTPLEAELAVKAGVFTAKPACFPLYPEEKDGKANTVSQGSVWILTFLCNLCHCGKSLNLSSLQCSLLKAEINIQQTLTKHLSWTSTCCFW